MSVSFDINDSVHEFPLDENLVEPQIMLIKVLRAIPKFWWSTMRINKVPPEHVTYLVMRKTFSSHYQFQNLVETYQMTWHDLEAWMHVMVVNKLNKLPFTDHPAIATLMSDALRLGVGDDREEYEFHLSTCSYCAYILAMLKTTLVG